MDCGPVSAMTPERRQAIIGEIAKHMTSGKHPAEIMETLTLSGMRPDEARQLVYEAGSRLAPVYRSNQPSQGDGPAPLVRSFITYIVVGLLLAIALGGGWHVISSSQPTAVTAQGSPQTVTKAQEVPVPGPSHTEPIWASGDGAQAGRNTYHHHLGRFRYGIIHHACDPSVPAGSDLRAMHQAQMIAMAEFAAGFNHNGIRIVTADGEQPARFQYICVLLHDVRRGGVYCGTITPAVAFFASSGALDEKRFEYQDIAVGTTGAIRYPIIERYDEKQARQTEASQRRISIEEARAIALPMIDDWLAHNGYDAHSGAFLRRDEKHGDQVHVFTVKGDMKALNEEGTIKLFTVEVDGKSGTADMLLDADCREFLRLLRAAGVVPEP